MSEYKVPTHGYAPAEVDGITTHASGEQAPFCASLIGAAPREPVAEGMRS